ncbi:hypothetical protein Mpet_0253 [Methanolacinia petrolearia DSM 11571]|uniref:Uncharacterized protein n=1 Tax=Methanolacinia petrolearia (strain DSM 11571 / OCM 486 / SEBR 4847) TaxID=679926 RepID=E1RF83_METP4|nr:hypothetical protein [Methanolacinia petrolearia]ADN35031.1 hypothetical protein Mpet_0253 [Methanolacinia petrolearia DSM 11571]
MKEDKIGKILKILSVPIIALAFLPVWIVVSSLKIFVEPDPRLLVGAIYASVLTLSFIYFGLELRRID